MIKLMNPAPTEIPVSTQSENIPSPSPKKTVLIIGAIVILFLTASGAFFLGKTRNNSQVSSTTLTPTQLSSTPSPSLMPSSDQTANWKTYMNNKYQISLKYPADYFRYSSPSDDTVYLAPNAGNGEGYGSPMGLEKKDIWLSVSINPTDNDLSIEQFLALPEMVDYKNAQKEAVTIANRSGYKVTIDKPSGPEGVVYYEGLVKNGKNIYRLQMSSFTLETLMLQENTFDQILSTFKFLDQDPKTSSNSSCTKDHDCTLVVVNSWSNCSLLDSCESIDYSQQKWIAVNQTWFSQMIQNCPPGTRNCFPKPINDHFSAKCINKLCQKVQN